MSASISLENRDSLQINATDKFRLDPGVGGARLTLNATIDRTTMQPSDGEQNRTPADQMRLHVTASLFLSPRVPQQDRLYVTELEAAHLVTAVEKASTFQMHGFIRDDQLRTIDELRAGRDFWLTIAMRVSYVDQTPPRLLQAGADLSISVESGVWLRRLAEARRGGFFEVFVPLDGGTDYETAEQELEKAHAELLGNNIDAALLAARKALETVRKAWKTTNIVRNVKKREASDQDPRPELKRTVPERFAFITEDLFAGLSGALHKEEGTKGYEYSRGEATTLIASVCGLVAQLAEERRSL